MAVVERMPGDCPRCGGEVVMIDNVSTGDDFLDTGTRTFCVVCPQCMIGSAPSCRSREEALHSWEELKVEYAAEQELRRNRG